MKVTDKLTLSYERYNGLQSKNFLNFLHLTYEYICLYQAFALYQ